MHSSRLGKRTVPYVYQNLTIIIQAVWMVVVCFRVCLERPAINNRGYV